MSGFHNTGVVARWLESKRGVWYAQVNQDAPDPLHRPATQTAATGTQDASSASSSTSAPGPRPAAASHAPVVTAVPGWLRAGGRLHHEQGAVECQAAGDQR